MNITVKLFATLRKGRFETKSMKIPEGVSVQQICRETGIPADEKLIILVNSRHADPDQKLSDGDTLAIFPLIGGG
jgi:sulfur-carrier protein